jgi:hypothetical protein
MILSKVVNFVYQLNSKFKLVIWAYFTNFSVKYYKLKRENSRNIVIVPHGGLGDLANIVPALFVLSKQHHHIYIVCNNDYFDAIKKLFSLPDNIFNINFVDQSRYNYKLSKSFINELSLKGRLILLGYYGNDPDFYYPNSFFIKLGVDLFNVHEKYNFNFLDFTSEILENLFTKFPSDFTYINLSTSDNKLKINNIPYINDKVISFGNSAEQIDINSYYDINELQPKSVSESIINNVLVCLKSSRTILSDAGLFNIVIKFRSCGDIIVLTRKHIHSHNKLLFKINFDGDVHIRSSNR